MPFCKDWHLYFTERPRQMTSTEQRLLDRAEKLRRRMIEAKSWLEHGDPKRALEIIQATLDQDG